MTDPSSPDATAAPVPGISRYALVIGNSAYERGLDLKNPARDAKIIAQQLEALGFSVELETDLDSYRFVKVVTQFCDKIKQAEAGPEPPVAILYFAGHGVQVKGENYLLPIDGHVSTELELNQRALKLDYILGPLGSAANIAVVILDCCRNNPLRITDSTGAAPRALNSNAGMAAPKIGNTKGLYIAFSTAPDSVASDGKGDNSPFAQALTQHVGARDTSIFQVMIDVRGDVIRATDGAQIPWDQHSLTKNFGFNTRPNWEPDRPPGKDEAERDFWLAVKDSDSPQMLLSFLRQYPYSLYRGEAGHLLDKLKLLRWRRSVLTRAGVVFGGLMAVLATYIALSWAMFSTVGGKSQLADLVGGDISLAVYVGREDATVFDDNIAMCRLGCILKAYRPTCVAFSFDVTYDKLDKVKQTKCYLKFQTAYSLPGEPHRPGKFDIVSHSEYSRMRLGAALVPKASPYHIEFDRRLQGVPVADELVTNGEGFKRAFRGNYEFGSKNTLKRRWWQVTGARCQKHCTDLKDECIAFSYTAIGGRCELFKSLDPVEPIITYAGNSGPIQFRGAYSGCKLPTTDCRNPIATPQPANPTPTGAPAALAAPPQQAKPPPIEAAPLPAATSNP